MIACGIAGSAATLLIGAGQTGPLGIGGMERLAVYPFPLCLMTYGCSILAAGRLANPERTSDAGRDHETYIRGDVHRSVAIGRDHTGEQIAEDKHDNDGQHQ